MPTTSAQTATYKGRTYRLLWSGQTKYGRRAHLEFMDGTKDFWVDASAISAGSAPSRQASQYSPRGRRTGCACGSREGEVRDTDCEQCRFDEIDG